ncbi:MAG: hypothetical protein HFG27_03065 [Provencibacterium sp.]|nr:hypothetical protein [Provencibacterium sp.]
MKTNRNWMLVLCLALVVALCGTVFVFAQGGGPVPGTSGEEAASSSQSEPLPSLIISGTEDTDLSEDGLTIGESSSGMRLQKVALSEEEIPIGEQLVVTLGASGCGPGSYRADVTFIGLESAEELTAFSHSNPSGDELTLRVHLPVEGPADTYALRAVLFTSEDGEETAFHSLGYADRSPSAKPLPQEVSFRAVDPDAQQRNEEITLYLSDPDLIPTLRTLGSGAKATILYGAKDEENYLAEAEIFEIAQQKGFLLQFDDGNALWAFSAGGISSPQELNLEIRGEYGISALEELIDWTTPYYAFRISGEGALPGTATIALQIGQMSRFDGGSLNLYRYDEAAGELKLIGGLTAAEGAITFKTAQSGVYVLCKELSQEVSSQPEETTEYLPIDEGDTEWFSVRDRMDTAEPGATVSVRIERDEPIPYWIIRSLCGKDLRLTLSDGSRLITLDGLSIDPPKRQPVFKMEELQELFG